MAVTETTVITYNKSCLSRWVKHLICWLINDFMCSCPFLKVDSIPLANCVGLLVGLLSQCKIISGVGAGTICGTLGDHS